MYITDARHFLDDKGAIAPRRGPAKAVGRHRTRAHRALLREVLGEEGLHQRGEAWRRMLAGLLIAVLPAGIALERLAKQAHQSGTPVRYQ
jgi:hypothetical protein